MTTVDPALDALEAQHGLSTLEPAPPRRRSEILYFALRNRNTNGEWVRQGKRPRFGVSSSPTLFAFFFGDLARISCRFGLHLDIAIPVMILGLRRRWRKFTTEF